MEKTHWWKSGGEYKKGVEHPYYGKKRPEHSLALKGRYTTGEWRYCAQCNKKIRIMGRRRKESKDNFCSRKCRGLWTSRNSIGEKATNWRGGINPINDNIRKSATYKTWRRTVFVRDEFTCRECGRKHIYIVAHHIKPFSKYPELRFDIDNGKTLCEECHEKYRKENYE